MVVSTGIVRETVFKYAWFFFELLVRFSRLSLCSVRQAKHTWERQSFLGQDLAGNVDCSSKCSSPSPSVHLPPNFIGSALTINPILHLIMVHTWSSFRHPSCASYNIFLFLLSEPLLLLAHPSCPRHPTLDRLGQPLHAFQYAKMKCHFKKIIAKIPLYK